MEPSKVLELVEIVEATRNLPKLRPLHDKAMRALEDESERLVEEEQRAAKEAAETRTRVAAEKSASERDKLERTAQFERDRLSAGRAEVQGEDARNG